MRVIKASILAMAVVGLTACTTVRERYGFIKDDTQTYRKAPPIEGAVVIPQNLSSRNMQDYYEIPEAAEASGNVPPMTPPGSNLEAAKKSTMLSQQDRIRSAENAKIQGHTSPRANVPAAVSLSYSQAWVKVGHVLQASNYKIVEKDNVVGTYYVIDTSKTGGKVRKDMPIYQVHLKASGNSTVVTVSPANPSLQNNLNRSLND